MYGEAGPNESNIKYQKKYGQIKQTTQINANRGESALEVHPRLHGIWESLFAKTEVVR
jgi:hypothetical protein